MAINRRDAKPRTGKVLARPHHAGAAGKPAAWSEKALQQEIFSLVARKQTDRATKVLIDALPAIQASNVNSKEKLNNLLYLARAIQQAGGSKHGYTKLGVKVRTLKNGIGDTPIPAGGFLELGCGAHDPLALAMYFYLNGLTPAFGVDLLSPRTPHFTAVAMYDILAHIKMFPGRYTWGDNRPSDIIAALRSVNVAAFESGDFAAGLEGLGGKVDLLSEDLLQCPVLPGSIALLTSFAVLEHVSDIDAVMRRCFELTAPGGIGFHFVDLADHRSYRGDGMYGPLSFLTEAVAPPNMNRLRAPQITAAARAAGFEIVKDQRTAVEMPIGIRSALVPPFDAMNPGDVAVTKHNLVLRKPA